ncbi:MAG: glycosyltransferase family 39 protein [Phaeodactylibacter sp.]|uniref:ArnT family glycosyltransferase n=1 Tax=Phaeodactylibacter sp. TaxID=1940289 RepID=UPI0032EE9DB5
MKKSIVILSILAVVKLILQLLGNRNYGFHRDELLHLSVSEHLDWGYMEFPPLIAWVGRLSYWLFDYSLMGTRLFPTLAGVLLLILCGLMARTFSKQPYAVLLAGVCFLAFVPFYRNHTLFQPVAFDQLFWGVGFYLMILFLKTENKKYLLLTGFALGLGLLTKYTILVWALGIFTGLLFHKRGKHFKNPWLYAAGLLAALLFLPNVLWQLEHNWPALRHLEALKAAQLDEIQPLAFGLAQLESPFTFLISLTGVYFLLKSERFRPIGVSAVVIFAALWILQAKPYYVFALYPVLFAAGAAQVANSLAEKRWYWKLGIAVVVLAPSIPFIPYATPLLDIDDFEAYAQLEHRDGRVQLTGDYADMFGWEEQTALVDSVYRSLSEAEKRNCVIWAENYGEAGAVKILGKKYGLPNPISRHGSFWSWGHGNDKAAVWISLGNKKPSVEQVFEEVELVKMIHHKYAIDEENGIPLYLCRKPKLDIEQWWKDYEPHIFD